MDPKPVLRRRIGRQTEILPKGAFSARTSTRIALYNSNHMKLKFQYKSQKNQQNRKFQKNAQDFRCEFP